MSTSTLVTYLPIVVCFSSRFQALFFIPRARFRRLPIGRTRAKAARVKRITAAIPPRASGDVRVTEEKKRNKTNDSYEDRRGMGTAGREIVENGNAARMTHPEVAAFFLLP